MDDNETDNDNIRVMDEDSQSESEAQTPTSARVNPKTKFNTISFNGDEDENFPFDISNDEEDSVLKAIKKENSLQKNTSLDFWINAVLKRIEEVKKPVRRFALAVAGLCMLQVYDVIDEMTSEEFKKTHVKDRTRELTNLMEELIRDIKIATSLDEASTKEGILRALLDAVKKYSDSKKNKPSTIDFGAVNNLKSESNRESESEFSFKPKLQMKIGARNSRFTALQKARKETLGRNKDNGGIKKPKDRKTEETQRLEKEKNTENARLIYNELKRSENRDGKDNADEMDYFVESLTTDVAGVLEWLDNLDTNMIKDPDAPSTSLESFTFVSSFICLNDTFLGLANVAMFDINQKYKKKFTLQGLITSDEVYVAFAKYVAFLYRQSVNNRAYTDVNNTSSGHSYHRSTTSVYGKTRFQINNESQEKADIIEFFATVREKEIWELVTNTKRKLRGSVDTKSNPILKKMELNVSSKPVSMSAQNGTIKNPLLEYAEKAFFELNPDSVSTVQQEPTNAQFEAMMKSPTIRTSLHGTVQEKNFSIYFHGSLEDFEKNPTQTKWSARGMVGTQIGSNVKQNEKQLIGNAATGEDLASNTGEYITLQDGSLGRLVLRKATVTAVQNTTSLPVGLTFNNLPSNVEVFSGQGQANPFHVVIPPNVNSPFPQNQRIFYDHIVNNDGNYVQGLLYDQPRRSTLTKSSIEDSIISRPSEVNNAPAWKVKIGSPLYQKAQEITESMNDTSGTTLFNIPDTKNGTQGLAVMANGLAEKAYNDLHAELESLPFHNPHSVGAEITRVDRRSWTNPTYSVNELGHDYGQDKNLKNPLFTRNKESIGAMLTVEYEVCKVEDAPHFDNQ